MAQCLCTALEVAGINDDETTVMCLFGSVLDQSHNSTDSASKIEQFVMIRNFRHFLFNVIIDDKC